MMRRCTLPLGAPSLSVAAATAASCLPQQYRFTATATTAANTATTTGTIPDPNVDISKKRGVPAFGRPGIYKPVPLAKLIRSLIVLRMCRSHTLVHQGPKLLKITAKYLGDKIAYETGCKWTFFNHFCAGTDAETIKPTLKLLENRNIGYILDYAAEAEVPLFQHASALKADLDMKSLVSRKDLKFKHEAEFDENQGIFIHCIDAARSDFPMTKMCFAAVKFTGLVDPQILARVSAIMLSIRREWVRLFTSDIAPKRLEDCRVVIGVHTDHRFATVERMMKGLAIVWGKITDSDLTEKERAATIANRKRFVDYLVTQGQKTGKDQAPGTENEHKVDYLVFCNAMTKAITTGVVPMELEPMVETLPSLTDEELNYIAKFRSRCETVMTRAKEKQVMVMIDAEQTFYQMAIDHFVRELQRKYNRGDRPIVYNTYQCYLKIAEGRLDNDMQRGDREGWKWAGKMVRGAYVEQEQRTAAEYGYSNPIHDTIEDTHAAYNRCAVKLVTRLADKSMPNIGVLFGTHNWDSLKLITSTLHELVPDTKDHKDIDLAFGQLFGMTDFLTVPLAESGYRAFKYVPYGPVKATVEYLSRRAQENSAIAGATMVDTKLIWTEVRSRPQFWMILFAIASILNYLVVFYLLPKTEANDPSRPSLLSMEDAGIPKETDGKKLVRKQ